MATCFLAPDPIQSTQFIPGGNTPANGGQLFFYAAGSSTKTTVYKDNAAGTAWTNPIVLDSGGNLPSGGEVWFPQGVSFKVVFAPSNDTDPPGSPYWTKDNLDGINDVSGILSEWVAASTPTFVSGTSFTLVGDETAAGSADVGRAMKFNVTAGTVYGTIASRSFAAGLTTVTLQMRSGVLDSGLSAAFYGVLTATNPSVPFLPGSFPFMKDPTDGTKLIQFDASVIPAGVTRTLFPSIPSVTTSNAYTITQSDFGKLIVASSTLTLTVTTATSLGPGFYFYVLNASAQQLTLAPSSSDVFFMPGLPAGGASTATLPYSNASTGPYNVSGGLMWGNGTNSFNLLSTAETHGMQRLAAGATTFSWTCPAGVNTIFQTGCGGGGGAGGNTAGNTSGGGGGAAWCYRLPRSVAPGVTYNGTSGTNGTGGSNGAGTAGSSTVFDTLVLAGGSGGTAAAGGGAGGVSTTAGSFSGGSGGNGGGLASCGPSGGNSLFPGGPGSVGNGIGASGFGGGSGGTGAAGSATAGPGAPGFFMIEW